MRFDILALSVEDEYVTREDIHQMLRRRFREVFVARNGAVLMQLHQTKGTYPVATDILMPAAKEDDYVVNVSLYVGSLSA